MHRDNSRTPRQPSLNRRTPVGLTSKTGPSATPHPLAALVDDAASAMKQGQWEVALRAYRQVRKALATRTPRGVLGMGATCLHRLGRYDEAEAWADDGLGEDRALLAIPPVHTEDTLRQRWTGDPTPVISILCTTFNHERYLESTIRGFLSQNVTYPFEILIHDDASTDGTQAIVRRWQERYPTLIRPVLQTENQFSQGIRPFELLLKRARGTFIATCEGDDFWIDAGKLQRQVEFLVENPDFSCSAHNYLHYNEANLTVKPFYPTRTDQVLSQRQLMGVARLLWLPTLVFRKLFDEMPPEQRLSFQGDSVLTSFLGTFGKCMYFESMLGSVRRENAFSCWSPLTQDEKEFNRMKTWIALVRMHATRGNAQTVVDLLSRVATSPLDEARKSALLNELLEQHPSLLGER
jgi:hypothetical protein